MSDVLRLHRRLTIGIASMVAIVVAQIVLGGDRLWPPNWNINLADPVDDLQTWIQDNRSTSKLFLWFFDPISRNVESMIDHVATGLHWLPWYALPLLAFVAIARTRRYASATMCALVALYPAAVGLGDATIETLALMLVSVAISVAIGLPLGILSANNAKADRIMRPILDAMQVIPATVYLIPTVILFSIGVVPAAVATIIYAVPPMVRLTALGLEQVPPATVEAATSFGASRRQSLRRVQLPLAAPSIVAGINQTIMMALGIVVIAALVGAGGLAQEITETLRLRSPGRGFVAGFAIVSIAMVLDRVSRAFTEPRRSEAPTSLRRYGPLTAVVLLILIGKAAGWHEIPAHLNTDIADWFDDVVLWIRDNWGSAIKTLNDFVVADVIIRSRDFLTETLAWPVLIALSALLSWAVKGWRLALATVIGLCATGLVGMWGYAIETLIQVLAAVIVTMVIALPVGVAVGRVTWLRQALSPVLDALQTIPSLIYAVPFVMVFSLGPVPGIIAAVLYALPPGIRLTALGIEQVPETSVEAATTFGASPRQVMWGVRIPLAMPSIILAVNQVIMMVLAMVIISGLIGGGGLGFQAVTAVTRTETGLGVEVAVAIVAMAMILDRLTQAIAQRFTPRRAA